MLTDNEISMVLSNELITDIADKLEAGLKCYLNTVTQEVVSFPDKNHVVGGHPDEWEEEIQTVEKNPKIYREINSMNFSESYILMQEFVNIVEDKNMKSRLAQAIQGPKPFSNFKMQIARSGTLRETWFSFKSDKVIEWVRSQLVTSGNK
ncbi:MAG TPA: UPF0158 family protein [Flavitalea sp.]|nr:UPF0158 family protein [Flavitalea sp.]